ncbi:MAG: Gfo/Idh/MocA family oxidoreductase [Chthoniobacterales bacterium]|nr:Gfo/Idh/MocA family oxidoreductase [Chthoniobacterales bacterium]
MSDRTGIARPVRLAVAGLGAVTRNIHLPAYARLDGRLEMVAGCDVDAAARDMLRQQDPAIRIFEQFAEMLQETKPDLVAICTPPFLHHQQCLQALDHGCDVFCEKPMAESLAEADEIIAAASAAQRHVVVNSQFPYMRIHTAAREQIGRADFGQLLFLHASQTFRPTAQTEAAWRQKMARRLGFEFGVHVFELIRFFFQAEPVRILAHMPNPTGANSDVLNLVSMEFADGRAASILLNRLSRGPERYLEMRLDGEFAAISTSIGGELGIEAGLHTRERRPYFEFRLVKGGKAVWQDGNRSRILAKDGINPFAHATAVHLGNFIDALAQNKTPAGSARDHRKTLALIFAAYDSAAAGASIELAPYLAPVAFAATGRT